MGQSRRKLHSEQIDLAAVTGDQADHAARQGRLTAARFAHQSDRLRAIHIQRNRIDRFDARGSITLQAAQQGQPKRVMLADLIQTDQVRNRIISERFSGRDGVAARHVQRPGGDFRPAVTADEMAIGGSFERWLRGDAFFNRQRAAVGKNTADCICRRTVAGRAAAYRCGLPQARNSVQQRDRIRVQRMGKQVGNGGVFHHFTGIEHGHPLADLRHHAQIVRHVQRGGALFADQVAEQVEHGRFRRHIKVSGRLVEHQQFGRTAEGHRNQHPLLHSAAELMRIQPRDPFGVSDAHFFQPVDTGRASLLPGMAAGRHDHFAKLGADGHRRVERSAGVLRHQRDLPTPDMAHIVGGTVKQRFAQQRDLPGSHQPVSWQIAHHRQRQRTLA